MTHLQITPEHPPADRKGDPATEKTGPGLQQKAPAPQEELDRAADEGMIAPPDEEQTRPAYEAGADR
jgi:hypothetical protein